MPSTPRSRSAASVHQEAVARRLAELCAQLGTPLSADEDADDGADGYGHLAAPGRAAYVAPAVGADWWDGYTHPPRPPLHLVAPPEPAPAPAVAPPTPVPTPVPTPGPGPEPGRHASRRPASDVGGPGSRRPVELMADLLDGLVPETLRGRVRLGISQLVVVAMLVALGLGVVLWSLARSRPTTTDLASASLPSGLPVGAPTTSSGAPAPATSGASGAASPGAAVAPSATTSATATGRLTVDVAGRVRHPGIEVLPSGSRVIDALRHAGGARPGVDLTSLNLARPLVDGEQILVGVKASAGLPATPGSSTDSGTTSSGVPTSPVDLNTATEEELEALPDVGPVTAGSILSWRQAHGGFTSVDELLEVDGIGPATLAKLTPYVTI